MDVLLVLALTVAVVIGAIYVMVKKLLWVATPNEALIFSGGKRKMEGRNVAYRFVRGGRRMRRPLIEQVDVMDLSMFTVMVHVSGAFSKGGIPLTVQGVANVKLPGDEPLLANAVERFLGRTREEIYYIAKETLEGNLRGVLASLTPEEVNEDKMRFAHTLLDEAEHDMSRMGLVLDTLKIQNVTDEVNYLASIGRIRGASLNQEQAVAEAEARADAQVQQATNWAASEIAKLDAELSIAREETAKRVADARSRREAMIQEARGQVVAQIAQVKAEIERQKARAPQEKRRLEADVVQPALARQRAAEEQARGEAANTMERGRAEAKALHDLVEAYRSGGTAARDVLALQNLLPMLSHVSGAHHSLSIGKMSVLPAQADGTELARKAIGASEQIRAATGVDLAGVAKKLGG
ncbi:MAG: flotillin family protein [Myxococcales bacterium]|nr:flotillin family protein [Myxococcales bacterium]MCB9578032.1 flotillin family protein [Polyangiaceae bacterium]